MARPRQAAVAVHRSGREEHVLRLGPEPSATLPAHNDDDDEHRLHPYADGLRALGVDPLWLLLGAYGAESRVQEWLRANGVPKRDLSHHVHEVPKAAGERAAQ